MPTGEPSDTLIYHMAERSRRDGRPAVVLYFSDFDPSGYQMPLSVSRKLQALNTLTPDDTFIVEVHPVAITLEQAIEFNLPSTPLKEGEKRRHRWQERFGREQTELDALIALRPGTLQQIARDAVAPFFDYTLAQRSLNADTEWRDQAQEELEEAEGYNAASIITRAAYNRLVAAIADYDTTLAAARSRLPEITAEVEVPEPQINEEDQPDPLFTTREEDWVAATRPLVARHRYIEDDE